MHVEKKNHGSLLQYVGPKSCSLQICCPKISPYEVMVQ